MRLTKRRDRLTPLSLLLDLALAAVAIYAACLLTAEVLTSDGSGASAVAAYTTAVVHGATVAIRRLAPRAAVVVLLITAAVYGIGLGLPVYMLGPAVLFVAYAVGGQFSRGPAAIWLAVIEVFLVLLLRLGSSFPGWDSVVLFAGVVAGAWLLGLPCPPMGRRWPPRTRNGRPNSKGHASSWRDRRWRRRGCGSRESCMTWLRTA